MGHWLFSSKPCADGNEIEKGHADGLYRILSFLIANEVIDINYTGLFSAGADNFKRNRGAVQEVECSFFLL
ncbi:hypothetical protein KHA94_08995 [Bacillus sp. FJAT-49705]|uniref:Uncharacterized protein n=1 Tax=Cytobacillus citreus TaxID=2833586 RepID=A0ABS5NTA0_9BACI|nr:hypothetical protein [Cytobacillus citreus]MBS4190338.1 hypothetical protein [Cytobacillus citreus]